MKTPMAAAILAAILTWPASARAQADPDAGKGGSDIGPMFSPYITARGGLWGSNDFDFHGSDMMVVAGGDVGVEILHTVAVFGSYDYAFNDGNNITSIGGNIGWIFPIGTSSPWQKSQVRGMIYGGASLDDFFIKEVDDLGLDFKKTVGWHGGVSAIWEIPDTGISIDFYAETRLLILDLDVNGSREERFKGGGGGIGFSLRL